MLIKVGFFLVLVGGGIFFADSIGPKSKLWWPDRPGRQPPTSIPWIIAAVGLGLVILGFILAG